MNLWVTLALLALLAAVGLWLVRAGRKLNQGQQHEAQAKAAKRVAESHGRGPRTSDDVDKRLSDPERKL